MCADFYKSTWILRQTCILFICIFSQIHMNIVTNLKLWICENLHTNTSYFRDEFGCLPSTHVEASLKECHNNHVRGCIREELLVLNLCWYMCIRTQPSLQVQNKNTAPFYGCLFFYLALLINWIAFQNVHEHKSKTYHFLLINLLCKEQFMWATSFICCNKFVMSSFYICSLCGISLL